MTEHPVYGDIGETGYAGSLYDRALSLIANVAPSGRAHGTQRLLDTAVVIRCKDAGIISIYSRPSVDPLDPEEQLQ